jgi:Ca2+-binding RTX toxin-like protein
VNLKDGSDEFRNETSVASSVLGGDGVDILKGGPGIDSFDGGTGDDLLDGGLGGDLLYGNQGNDSVTYVRGNHDAGVTVILDNLANDGLPARNGLGPEGDFVLDVGNVEGRFGPDVLVGDEQPNTLNGWEGNDVLIGLGGHDRLFGQGGSDILSDGIYGGDPGGGNDMLDGGGGSDGLFGGPGIDRADYVNSGGDVAVTVGARAGDDGGPLDGPPGARDTVGGDVEHIRSFVGDDTLIGNDATNILESGPGKDALIGNGGTDWLLAGTGEDIIRAQDGVADVISCSTGPDRVFYDVSFDLFAPNECF